MDHATVQENSEDEAVPLVRCSVEAADVLDVARDGVSKRAGGQVRGGGIGCVAWDGADARREAGAHSDQGLGRKGKESQN